MLQVAIVGAGELGGAVAWALARCDLTLSVCLVDEAGQVAAGKALDIMQAGPLEGFATRVVGSNDLFAAAGASMIVLADRADRSGPISEWQGSEGLTLLGRLREIAGERLIVCAGSTQRDLVERGVFQVGFARERLLGSAPEALASALRAFVALEANGSPGDVAVTVLGIPPSHIVVPWEQSAIGGLSISRVLDSQAIRRLSARVAPLWPPGPQALAAATIRAIEVISGRSRRMVSCFRRPGRPGWRRWARHRASSTTRLGRRERRDGPGAERPRSNSVRECDVALADADRPSSGRVVQRESAGEVCQLPAENQPPAVQPRLQRLILHAKHCARLFSRHALNVPEHDRRAIDCRKRQNGTETRGVAAASETLVRRAGWTSRPISCLFAVAITSPSLEIRAGSSACAR